MILEKMFWNLGSSGESNGIPISSSNISELQANQDPHLTVGNSATKHILGKEYTFI